MGLTSGLVDRKYLQDKAEIPVTNPICDQETSQGRNDASLERFVLQISVYDFCFICFNFRDVHGDETDAEMNVNRCVHASNINFHAASGAMCSRRT